MESITLAFRAHFRLAWAAKEGPEAQRYMKQAKRTLIKQFQASTANTEAGRRFYSFLRACTDIESANVPPVVDMLRKNTGLPVKATRTIANYCVKMMVTDRRRELVGKHGKDAIVAMWLEVYDLLHHEAVMAEAKEESRDMVSDLLRHKTNAQSCYETYAGPGHVGVQMANSFGKQLN